MSDLARHVEQNIHSRRLFQPGQRILVAVSGGVDSVVLLHLLHELSLKRHWRLTVAHFNHRLRGRSSEADERLVRRMAERLELPAVVEGADVRGAARAQKVSLEMAARRLRHEFLARAARRRDITAIALAHHADDQVELFFLRLLRGSGGEGLGGMKWRSPSPSDAEIRLVRPLLDQSKAALSQYAAEHRVPYREDATNALAEFERNRIRHGLLPLLRREYQPALDKIIPRVMEIVGAEAEFVGEAARDWIREGGSPKSEVRSPKEGRRAKSEAGGARQPGFERLPVAVQRRCVQLQLIEQGIVPEFELIEELRRNAERAVAIGLGEASEGWEGWQPSKHAQGTGETAVLRYAVRDRSGMVRLQSGESQAFRPGAAELNLQGRGGEGLFDGVRIRWRIRSKKWAGRPRSRVGQEYFDADKVGSAIRLRHWRPGDRFQPIGMAGPVKLQDFFTNQKVPRDQRRWLTVAVTGQGEVFWVEGMRISERFKLTPHTNRCLQWCWKRP